MDAPRALRHDELEEAVGTPGLTRRVAFEDDGHWFGHVEAEPDTMSGWHHHGDNVTLGYVLSGRATLEFGPDGAQTLDVEAGQYFMVPARTVHREGNMDGAPAQLIITRTGQGPPVFPVDGPEPS
jgi:uncharacterized RmlC-like cupin family protein